MISVNRGTNSIKPTALLFNTDA